MLRDCESCEMPEERLFKDTWTGRLLCITCLSPIIDRITFSPSSEGDNLDELLKEIEGDNSA